MRLTSTVTPLLVDQSFSGDARGELTGGDDALVQPQLLAHLLDIVDVDHSAGISHDTTTVSQLTSGLGIERSAVEDNLNLIALCGKRLLLAIGNDAENRGFVGKPIVTSEGRRVFIDELAVDVQVGVRLLLCLAVGLCTRTLLSHLAIEFLAVDGQASFFGHLDGQVDWEAVGVMQGEGVVTG